MENLLTTAKAFGYCKDGKVYLNGYLTYPDREIGVVRNTEDEALIYFANRFTIAFNKVEKLYDQVETTSNKGSYLTKLLQLKKDLIEFDALGDFIPLLQKLDHLEVDLREMILNNQIKNLEIKKALIDEAKAAGEIQDWQLATEAVMEVKTKWMKTGPVDRLFQDSIEDEFNEVCDEFFLRRRNYFAERNRIIDEKIKKLQSIVEEAFALRKSDDIDVAFERIRDLQKEWKTVGPIPAKKQSQLWKQFKKANDWFFERYNRIKGIVPKPRVDPKLQQLMDMTFELERLFPDQNSIPFTSDKAKGYLVKWKELSAQVKPMDKQLAERFRTICDKIFEMNYLLRVISYRHPELNVKPRHEQLKIMINQMDYMSKKEKTELEIFIDSVDHTPQMQERTVVSKINTQKRKIFTKEILLTEFKRELEVILGEY